MIEYLSAGGCDDGSPNLLAEGRAMRDAVVADLAAVCDVGVAVAVGDRFPGSAMENRRSGGGVGGGGGGGSDGRFVSGGSGGGVNGGIGGDGFDGSSGAIGARVGTDGTYGTDSVQSIVAHPGETLVALAARLAATHDAVWAIAPETGGALADLCAAVPPPQWLGCTLPAIRLAGSKRATLARLQAAGIATPLDEPTPQHWVVKPDDGAGTEHTRRHADAGAAAADMAARARRGESAVCEPWVAGDAMSITLRCTPDACTLLSVNRQHVDVGADGCVRAHGVTIDVMGETDPRRRLLAATAAAVHVAVPGLCGCVGVDIVWHPARGPVVIEVNPRTTSAYVGLSAAIGRNVAAAVVAAHLSSGGAAFRDGGGGGGGGGDSDGNGNGNGNGNRDRDSVADAGSTPRAESAVGQTAAPAGVTTTASTTTSGSPCRPTRRPVQPIDPAPTTVGWDIGGAHVKACVWHPTDGVQAVLQWPCPLWQGLDQLHAVLRAAHAAWPVLGAPDTAHAVTMTGEMVDAFADRRDGVLGIAGALVEALPGPIAFYAGDAGWRTIDALQTHWPHVASANWLATAMRCAQRLGGDGLLLDIGSTTTDVIAWRGGRISTTARSDADRLASGELVYHGVVRTPLCALAGSVVFRGVRTAVMNELFATTADVYRLTGELRPDHDQQPAADGGAKTLAATRQRLARMVGRDAADAGDDDWLRLAEGWRDAQRLTIGDALRRVADAHRIRPGAALVAAGCGAFLAPHFADELRLTATDAAAAIAGLPAGATADAVRVAAPCVAVAALFTEHGSAA